MTPLASHDDELYAFATLADLPEIVRMLQDPAVGRWLWFCPATREELHAFFEPLLQAQARALAEGALPSAALFVVRDREGTFLGQGAAVSVAPSPGGVELGFQLPRHTWGRGVGTRLGRFLRAYAVFTAGAERLEGHVLAGNEASRRILLGLGLHHEGTRRGYRLKEMVRHDEDVFGVLVSELPVETIESQARALGLRRGRV